MIREIVTVGGIDRLALVRDAGPRAPVVLMLHGTGSTAEWCNGETQLSAFAARHGFTLVLPEGLPPASDKPPKFLTNPTRWNDGSTKPGDRLHVDADDVGFLAAVVARVSPGRPVLLAGFSNGAGMAFRFAAERPELLLGLLPVSGCNWTSAKPNPPVPTLFLLGKADPLFPMTGGSARSPWGGRLRERPTPAAMMSAWAKLNGCAATPLRSLETTGVEVDRYDGPVRMTAKWLPGHGHHWPSGAGQLGPSMGGPTTAIVDANEELRAFLSELTSSSRPASSPPSRSSS